MLDYEGKGCSGCGCCELIGFTEKLMCTSKSAASAALYFNKLTGSQLTKFLNLHSIQNIHVRLWDNISFSIQKFQIKSYLFYISAHSFDTSQKHPLNNLLLEIAIFIKTTKMLQILNYRWQFRANRIQRCLRLRILVLLNAILLLVVVVSLLTMFYCDRYIVQSIGETQLGFFISTPLQGSDYSGRSL
ncbi:Hypothetical_protein [Hexamita inflata]|uniref:Hypothetical_protein n=1 Tax=Hexamita inflata TaxID=28002 RepID=A0AA86QW81_9EUKA|nr:Hypothetical protein HINF_LOCUS679 [Hexamita inflata]CAI9967201.1 Hypothetical protein HINF_LOCUS54846 [Hexamita inflata]CAI9967202.1 Hypothetical protein HINF_LOCUS54847 [Hexamita inflata]